MKNFARFKEHPWLPICMLALVAMFSVGCTSSRSRSGAIENPLAAYETSTEATTSTSTGTVIGDGSTMVPGSLITPVITVPEDGSTGIEGHDNAPLLDNKHPGWQQSSCLTCHNDTTNNPDHNYSDDSLCYLCHGTNGLPGMADSTPPVLSSVVVTVGTSGAAVVWNIKTLLNDEVEVLFPLLSVQINS